MVATARKVKPLRRIPPCELFQPVLNHPRRRWTPDELQYLRDNAGKVPYADIAHTLRRTTKQIFFAMECHEITPHPTPGAKERLILLVSTSPEPIKLSEAAAAVGCTIPYVYQVCHAMRAAGIDLFSKLARRRYASNL